ncbi:hypothetical protein ACFE04_022223 [Oxalis oulophora]
METTLGFILIIILVTNFLPFSTSQNLPSSETTALFQVQKLLEYPEILQPLNNSWTNFCYLPYTYSLKIICTNNHITELTIVGNRTSPLSDNFSIDSFFTTLTKLSSLKLLSIVSLGIWGQLPEKINRFWSLEVLNVSSNFIDGVIPKSISSIKTLKYIVLADNRFTGSVPDLRSLTSLQELNLGNNHINGSKFPSLSNTLVSIILKNNSVRSDIPSGVKSFRWLRRLDLSYNKFIGPIPSFLFDLPSIVYINLAQNQFTGAIPTSTSCSANLVFVDISHNLLIGKLPSCIGSSNSVNKTVNSTWNCLSSGNAKSQFPYSHCNKEALAVKPPSEIVKKKSGIHLGLILGIIGGIIGLVVGIVVLIFFIVRKSVNNDKGDKYEVRSVTSKMSARSASVASKRSVRSTQKPPITEPRRVPQRMRSAMVGLPPYRVLTLEEIEDATNNFDPMNFLGEDAQGQLYKAWLTDGSTVQVKCVKVKQKNLSQTLTQHMEVVSKLRHRHVISVLGHCIATYQDHSNTAGTVFVVFEYISNGSLQDYLTDSRKKESLKWPQRMAITIGAARGIQFLHTGVAPGLFGNNVKIENILLDDTLSAKLSGWNIPLPHKTRQVGYESPMAGQISDEQAEKEDVYQLGIILLQVTTGIIVKSPGELKDLKLQLERGLLEGPSKLCEVIDKSVRGSFAYDSLKTTIEITANCLSDDLSKRPSIEDVLWNLQYSIQVQEGWTTSGNLGTPS